MMEMLKAQQKRLVVEANLAKMLTAGFEPATSCFGGKHSIH